MLSFKRKLNLRKIHALYLALRHCLPVKEHQYLIDQIDEILDKAQDDTVMKCLEIMYGKNFSKKNYVELLSLFIRGLRENDFFAYVNFVKGMSDKDAGKK